MGKAPASTTAMAPTVSMPTRIGARPGKTGYPVRLSKIPAASPKVDSTTMICPKIVKHSDRAGGELDFPAITLDVDCDSIIVNPDECGTATSFQVDGCADSTVINGNDTTIKDLGRIVQVDVPIKNVCPNKRLAVGVILTEIDSGNIEHNRGMKTLLIPPIESTKCENIIIKCVSFVVPEALDTTGNVDALCNSRDFKARVLVNYVDTDFVCCNPETVIVE